MSLVVKICGVTSVEDALAAVDAGADWVGLNLWPNSKRHLTLERALPIARALQGKAVRVGVFVNATRAQVQEALDTLALDRLQFHGDEDPAFIASFGGRAIAVVRVGGDGTDAIAAAARAGTDPVLLDTQNSGYGGSGTAFDWAIATHIVSAGTRAMIAGGLRPDNVAEAVIQVGPVGVDVAGGVEHLDGRKDPIRMQDFVRRAKQAAATRGR